MTALLIFCVSFIFTVLLGIIGLLVRNNDKQYNELDAVLNRTFRKVR